MSPRKIKIKLHYDEVRETFTAVTQQFTAAAVKPSKPAHNKAYNKPCATSEDSDQPARPRSLISVFADQMCRLQIPTYSKRNKRKPSPYWVDVQADMSLW